MDSDLEARRIARSPEMREAIRETATRQQDVLRDQYGILINYVSPVEWQGRKVWALGSRVYADRPPKETFHEFLLSILRETLGEEWRLAQKRLAASERHFVMRCFDEYLRWKQDNLDIERLGRDGTLAAHPDGWTQYLISLAWDVATLRHASNLPESLVSRLRDRAAFQGARYEFAVAAIFARLDCEITFLDEDELLSAHKHVEFIATHRPSGTAIAVEAKSRHREGVLNTPGEPNEDPLRGDLRSVRRLFVKAIEKSPEDMPFIVFIDINAPIDRDAEGFDRNWIAGIRRWMDGFETASPEKSGRYSMLCVTNFSPHYEGEDLATAGEWLCVEPGDARWKVDPGFLTLLQRALDCYHRVPEIAEGGIVLT